MSYRDINLQVMNKLSSYGAINIRDTPMSQTKDKNEKIRYLFEIDDRDKALECYKFFNEYYNKVRNSRNHKKDDKHKKSQEDEKKDEAENNEFNLKELMKIYLQKEENTFVKYADEEAEIYE